MIADLTVSYFQGLEARIPAVQAERSMQMAQAATYPHATKDGAERMWRSWVRQAEPPRPLSGMPVKGALFTLNNKPVSISELRAGLGAELGQGLSA